MAEEIKLFNELIWYAGYSIRQYDSDDYQWTPGIIAQQIWFTTSLWLGVVGNVFVLHATIFHSAIKLDKLSIWIIQNLAVCDILNCLAVLLPTTINYYNYPKWILGVKFCIVESFYVISFTVANFLLINILACNKIHRCLYPLHNLIVTRKQKLWVTFGTLVWSILVIAWSFYQVLVWEFSSLYDPITGACQIMYFIWNLSNAQKMVICAVIIVLGGIPCLTLVMSNIALITIALRKSNSGVNKMNIVIVLLVTICFLLSALPQVFILIIGNVDDAIKHMAWCLSMLSMWVNPYIYFATNNIFRKHTIRYVTQVLSRSSVFLRSASNKIFSREDQES